MTKAQINYIVENILNDSLDEYTPLLNNFSIVISKDENLYSDISQYRMKFNSSQEIIERIMVRKYSEDINNVPKHGNYDIVSENGKNIIYEYLTDKNGNIITDYYTYDAVVMFIPSVEVRI